MFDLIMQNFKWFKTIGVALQPRLRYLLFTNTHSVKIMSMYLHAALNWCNTVVCYPLDFFINVKTS